MIKLRKATFEDLPEILDIYNEAITTSPATFDLEEQTVERRTEWFFGFDEYHPFLVAEVNHRVIGYSYLSTFKTKPAYLHTAESSIYVHKAHRRRGVAIMLMQDLIRQARRLNYHVIIAGIANDSESSVKLHQSLGYEKIGCLKEVGFKFGQWHDVCFYQLTLD